MARPRRTSEYEILADKTVRVHLTGGHTTVIDYEDIDLTDRCWGLRDGYVKRPAYNETPRNIRMHRQIMERVLERKLASNELVDHINGDTTDNRRSNLRLATFNQNVYNRAPQKNSRFGYKGIKALTNGHKRNKPYAALIFIEKKRHYIAFCETPEEAAWMYDQYALEIHGEYARLNLEYV